jgi:hypothetical protein
MIALSIRAQWLHSDETPVDTIYVAVCVCAFYVIVNHQREREREREGGGEKERENVETGNKLEREQEFCVSRNARLPVLSEDVYFFAEFV